MKIFSFVVLSFKNVLPFKKTKELKKLCKQKIGYKNQLDFSQRCSFISARARACVCMDIFNENKNTVLLTKNPVIILFSPSAV